MLSGLSGYRPLNRHGRDVSLVVIILLAIGCHRSLLLLGSAGEHVVEAAVAIEVVTDPPREQILPDTGPAQLTFVASVDGRPLDSGRLAVRAIAPPRPKLLSTPFPAVEGTTLFQLASDLTAGKFTVEYLFPVHGVYAFEFDITPVLDGHAVQATKMRHSLPVHADPVTVRRGWLLRIVLFSLGGIAGAWYARSAHTQKNPPSRAVIASGACVLGGLVFVTGTLAFADHGPRELVFPKGPQVIQGDDGWALEIRPTPVQAVIGELVDLHVTLRHEGEVFSGAMDVAMHLYNLQDDQTVLRTSVLAPNGSTSQRVQLVKSALHTCSITVRPVSEASGKPATPTSLTAVIGIDVVATPVPITVKLRVIGLFLGVVGAGMVGGFLLSSGVRRLPGRVER